VTREFQQAEGNIRNLLYDMENANLLVLNASM
jgi:hypothetical protein